MTAYSGGCCSGWLFNKSPPTAQTLVVNRDQDKSYEHLFKIVLIGDTGVGKSCLLLRFIMDSFSEAFISTIGIDFKFKIINLDGMNVKLQIWDTGGQERFRTVTTAFYRGAHGIMVVYDVTNQESFDYIPQWLVDIDKYAPGDAARILVATKCDMEEQRCVDYATAKKFADEQGLRYIETSPKDGTNVEEAFITHTADVQNAMR